jgi:hypothetical protein
VIDNKDVCTYIVHNSARLGFTYLNYRTMLQLKSKSNVSSSMVVIKSGGDKPIEITGARAIQVGDVVITPYASSPLNSGA